jgi:hypothetical protein
VLCGTNFFRKYAYHRSNQRYCSKECYDELAHRKNGRRNFLTILSEVAGEDGLTSIDLAEYMDKTIWKSRSAASIAGMMRRWVRAGVVQKVSRGSSMPIYKMNPDWVKQNIPLATLV